MKATASSTATNNSTAITTRAGIVTLELSKIVASGYNPRRTTSDDDLRELADSIRQLGVLQPVLVRPKGKKFEIVCGERRYRASVLAETRTIPAVVRKLSDDEALEIAITENLQRRDVSPIEEGTAYKRLADTGRYDTASLAVRFGKSESYIRNRMRLNDLTDDLVNLVNEDAISVSVALELCKYGRDTQEIIYQKHLQPTSNGYYLDWRNLTAKEFVNRLERDYTTDLSRYRFDKSECVRCAFNTNCYNLFPEEGREGKCTNGACLMERNRLYLVASCREVVEQHPDVEVCKSPWGTNNDDVYAELSEQGYGVDTQRVEDLPEHPQEPLRGDFDNEKEFNKAVEEYYSDVDEYRSEMDRIERMLAEGKARRVVTVEDNDVVIGYVDVSTERDYADGTGTATAKGTADPRAKLEGQDKRNGEIAVERIVEDAKQMIRNSELPRSEFTEIEDKYLYYTMLSDIKREHIAILSGDPENDRWYLSDEEKVAIISNLTEEQKTFIRRDYLIKHLSDTFGTAKKSYLMLEFARLHFPDDLAEIETKYNDVYAKRHARIVERLNALDAGTDADNGEVAEEVADVEETQEVA